MDSHELRYEAGEFKKKVISKHAEILEQATDVKFRLFNAGENLSSIVDELNEISKLAKANAEYYTELSNIVDTQLTIFNDIQTSLRRLEELGVRFPAYIGNCIECKRELLSNSAYREEEPGNYLCLECFEKITTPNI